MRNRNVLLTGATGIMGSWVLGEALARGFSPVVLLRDPDHARAAARIETVLEHLGRPDDMERIRIVLGDARHPHLGLAPREEAELRECIGAFVHCAACTSFNPSQDDEIWATNVDGVAHILEFIQGTSIPLYHVSTAYVAGKRVGVAHETELDEGQEFNNAYERSKFESEKMVRRAFKEGRATGCIFRPSIIMGSSTDGRILQFMNFYNVMRMIDLLSQRRTNQECLIRVEADIRGTKNLIPVDWAVQAMWHIIELEGPTGLAYHLTNSNPMTHYEMEMWSNVLLSEKSQRIELVSEIEGELTSLEGLIASSFSNYRPYMGLEPSFDRTNTDKALRGAHAFPDMNPEYFRRLMAYAQSEKWRSLFDKRKPALRRASSQFAGCSAVEDTAQAVG